MLPLHRIIWHEWREKRDPVRVPEPEAMTDAEQIRSYIKAYEWGGPTSALQLYHLRKLSRMIRPGDRVLDLACGPGPLLLELARLYPECEFIGADLSPPMLEALVSQASAEGLRNVRTLCEDIRYLPSLEESSVDVVISTSALHHLPDLQGLRLTFVRAKQVAKPTAGIYFFDFGLLRSEITRDLMVTEVARLAQPITVHDYAVSLDAAFPVEEVAATARAVFGDTLICESSAFVDFFYFLRSNKLATEAKQSVLHYLDRIHRGLTSQASIELFMLQLLQRSR